MNPFVFIVGCPRSGTTLLQRIVDSHPQITITPETHWIPEFCKRDNGLLPHGWVTPEFISHLGHYRTFANLGIGLDKLEELLRSRGSISYAQFVTDIFDLYGKAQRKRLVGDKTPGYVRSIRLLHILWPRAKFIHLIRDGRDVCLSVINWKKKVSKLAERFPTWSEDPVSTAALWWEWHVRSGRQEARTLESSLYYEVRYESLIVSPVEECTKLCAFLNVPFDQVMLNFHEGRMSTESGLDAKHAWLPITPGLRNWRTQMPAGDLERFEAAAGALLDELDYVRAVPCPGPQTIKHAVRIREQFPKEIPVLGAIGAG